MAFLDSPYNPGLEKVGEFGSYLSTMGRSFDDLLSQASGLFGLSDEYLKRRDELYNTGLDVASKITSATAPFLQKGDWGGAYAAATGALAEGVAQWRPLLQKIGKQMGVPEAVLAAIMQIESGGRPSATSPAGARGLMQVMPYHFKPGQDPYNPETNVSTAARILADAFKKYGSWEKAAAAYFGAISPTGQVTGARDVTGTSGYQYVQMFKNLLNQYGGSGHAFPIPGYTGQIAPHWGQAGLVGGTDLFAPRGTPVVSISSGTVTHAGWSDLGGYHVQIRGDDGRDYYYAHFDRMPAVAVGQRVASGTYLGPVGNTGSNAQKTQPHLHVGIGYGIVSGSGGPGGTGRNFDAVRFLRGLARGESVGEAMEAGMRGAALTSTRGTVESIERSPSGYGYKVTFRGDEGQNKGRLFVFDPIDDLAGIVVGQHMGPGTRLGNWLI